MTNKAIDKIMLQSKNGYNFPKFIAEGVMIKLPESPYQAPENHGWLKWKEKFEIDALVVGKNNIKREGQSTGSFNYLLAVGPISIELSDLIRAKDKSAVVEYKDKFYNFVGKSDNTNQKVGIGNILRVAAEDVNEFTTDNPEYRYYGVYVAVVLQAVPEKSVPDGLQVLSRLAELTPKRESMIKSDDDVRQAIIDGKMSKEIYKTLAQNKEPLSNEWYIDYREGDAWAQSHIRGITDEEVADYQSKKKSLAEIFDRHSVHIDLRIDFGLSTLTQFVFTDNTVGDLILMMSGGKTTNKVGKIAQSHSMMIVKPSAEEPQKFNKTDIKIEPAIDSEGAEALDEIQIMNGSYMIKAGGVGASSQRNAWMGLIWTGKVKSGVQRNDLHELFLFSDDNNKLLDGRMVIKALTDGKTNRWEVWMATTDEKPMDPILHADTGHFYPVPAEKVTKLGRDSYKEESQKLYREK
jgi:rhodanese-related sulfurtransferase